jgi:DNA-binding FadR family transcriptional regulator
MTTATFHENSRVARSLATLLKSIVDGKYGTTLPPQETLSKDLGVSRTVMREAIVILRFCNVLSIRPKIGTRIRPSSEWNAALLGLANAENDAVTEQAA